MPDPLSAALMTRVWSLASFLSAACSILVRFGWNGIGSRELIWALILCRYASMGGLAGGGVQVDFFLNGCSGPDVVAFLK